MLKLMFKSCFYEVIDALLILYKSNVNLPLEDEPTTLQITDNCKHTPYFDDCLSALNGIHIKMWIPTELQPRYRNRKGTLS